MFSVLTLDASGKDSLSDMVMSSAVVVAALFYIFTGITIEAWLALIIAILILKSGFDILKDTLSIILGNRPDPEVYQEVVDTLTENDQVLGAYDLFFHDYGPEKKIASVHIEVPDTMTADEIDILSRKLSEEVYKKDKVILSAVGIYSYNTKDEETRKVRQNIHKILEEFPAIHQVHGFYYNSHMKELRFDVIIGFEVKNREKEYEDILHKIKNEYPSANIRIGLDSDISG